MPSAERGFTGVYVHCVPWCFQESTRPSRSNVSVTRGRSMGMQDHAGCISLDRDPGHLGRRMQRVDNRGRPEPRRHRGSGHLWPGGAFGWLHGRLCHDGLEPDRRAPPHPLGVRKLGCGRFGRSDGIRARRPDRAGHPIEWLLERLRRPVGERRSRRRVQQGGRRRGHRARQDSDVAHPFATCTDQRRVPRRDRRRARPAPLSRPLSTAETSVRRRSSTRPCGRA